MISSVAVATTGFKMEEKKRLSRKRNERTNDKEVEKLRLLLTFERVIEADRTRARFLLRLVIFLTLLFFFLTHLCSTDNRDRCQTRLPHRIVDSRSFISLR